MAERNKIASSRVKAGKFTYFFDVNESKSGEHLYLTINQSEFRGEGEPREYNRLTVFGDNIKDFYEGLCESIRAFRDEQKKREAKGNVPAAQAPGYDAFADEE